jgi:hypothetical protein
MQPSLLFDAPARVKKRTHVPASSVEAYRQTDAKGRAMDVLRVLQHHAMSFDDAPTSAELSSWWSAGGVSMRFASAFEQQLWFRRGLSDLQVKGLVEKAGERTCAVSGRKCVTWRVVSR